MIFFALAFVLGAFCLQQMPALPSLFWAIILISLLLFYIRLTRAEQPLLILLKHAVLVIFATVAGFFWAAAFASIRLADELPAVWENKAIQVVGVVASISELTERGERFRFDVEKVLTKNAVVPRHISLNYYPPAA